MSSSQPSSGLVVLRSLVFGGGLIRLIAGLLLTIAILVLGAFLISANPERWQPIADPALHPLALVSDPSHPDHLWLGTEQGVILISRDGGQSWSESRQGLPASPVVALAVLPDGVHLIASTSVGVARSSDGGTTWQATDSGIPTDSVVDAVAALPDGSLLAGTADHGLFISHDGGANWLPAAPGLPAHSDVYAFQILPQSGHVLAALISGGVFQSADGGMTWTESDQGLPASSGINVFSFLFVPATGSNAPAIFAGTSSGVYVSRDGGVSWAPSNVGIGTTRVISLARDPATPASLVAGADTGVYQSSDDGVTWRKVGQGLPPELHVGVVAVVHPNGDREILASADQLYRYPGQGILMAGPGRALGIAALVLLAAALVGVIVGQVRAMQTALRAWAGCPEHLQMGLRSPSVRLGRMLRTSSDGPQIALSPPGYTPGGNRSRSTKERST